MPLPRISALSRRELIRGASRYSAQSLAFLGISGLLAPHLALAADMTAKPVAKDKEEAPKAPAPKDSDKLNTLLSLEHQIISAYQIGADSGLLKQTALNISLLFQSHHKAHRDALTALIEKANGTAVPAQTTAEYSKSLNSGSLKVQNDFLELALKLELGNANGYIAALPSFEDRDITKTCGRILADAAMHWTALASTLAQPLPANAMFFGS